MKFEVTNIKSLVIFGVSLAVGILLAWILTRLNKRFFKRLQKEQKDLHISFLERFVNIFIVLVVMMIAISVVDGTRSVWRTLLSGTAVISAVAAFAAQDVIKDILAGWMISIYKPFDIGDRIELEDGTAGVVEDITMRHIVITTLDTIKEVIPNSRLNAMLVKNYSFKRDRRSVHFRFPIGYDSDVALAKQVIAKAVEDSEFTVPGRTDSDGNAVYSPVYFLALEDSALIMAVTVYYERTSPTERVKDDVNSRVREALADNHIEIPYRYINVVQR